MIANRREAGGFLAEIAELWFLMVRVAAFVQPRKERRAVWSFRRPFRTSRMAPPIAPETLGVARCSRFHGSLVRGSLKL